MLHHATVITKGDALLLIKALEADRGTLELPFKCHGLILIHQLDCNAAAASAESI